MEKERNATGNKLEPKEKGGEGEGEGEGEEEGEGEGEGEGEEEDRKRGRVFLAQKVVGRFMIKRNPSGIREKFQVKEFVYGLSSRSAEILEKLDDCGGVYVRG